MKTPTINRAGQRGASLVMSLIIIVVLMLLGVSALMVSNTQQKLAGNVRFQALAQAEAESALAQAENWIAKPENTVTLAQFGVKKGLYAKVDVVDPLTMPWTDNTSISCADTTFFAASTPCTNPDSQRVIVQVYA